MVAGGISFYGLSDLIFVNGSMNTFSYAQALDFYKNNYDDLLKKNENLKFEQDGATCHTSQQNIKFINENFKNFIQNAPSSPDIAYPIETLWKRLKKKIKEREPKNKNDLKKFAIEEWNKIPLKYIKNQFKNFEKRCEKVIELKGGRLEPIHLKNIRN